MSQDKYYCYILRSTNEKHLNKTYNGSTNNMKRRLRQHNGELVGGAKSTHNKGLWIPYVILTGFESKIEALCCEYRIKHPTNKKLREGKYNGVKGRVKSLNIVLNLDRWTNNLNSSGLISNKPYTLYIEDQYRDLIDINNIKDNITILSMNEFNDI